MVSRLESKIISALVCESLILLQTKCRVQIGGDDYLDVRDQVLLLESLLKEKKDELKRLETVDAEKNRLFAITVNLGLTVDDAIDILQRHRSVGKME